MAFAWWGNDLFILSNSVANVETVLKHPVKPILTPLSILVALHSACGVGTRADLGLLMWIERPTIKADIMLALILATNVPKGNQFHLPFSFPFNRDKYQRKIVPKGDTNEEINED
jgi:hypothetical protein